MILNSFLLHVLIGFGLGVLLLSLLVVVRVILVMHFRMWCMMKIVNAQIADLHGVAHNMSRLEVFEMVSARDMILKFWKPLKVSAWWEYDYFIRETTQEVIKELSLNQQFEKVERESRDTLN